MTVDQMLTSKLELDNKQKLCDDLELNEVLTRDVSQLSGGELQRFAIAMTCIQKADVYVLMEIVVLMNTQEYKQIHVRLAVQLLGYQTTPRRC